MLAWQIWAGTQTDWAVNSVESLPNWTIMNCSLLRESQTAEGVDFKQKETLCEHTTQFWERKNWLNGNVMSWNGTFFSSPLFYMTWTICSFLTDFYTAAAAADARASAKTHGILPTSAQTKHPPAFILVQRKMGVVSYLPSSDGTSWRHTVNTVPTERSHCLSTMGPGE